MGECKHEMERSTCFDCKPRQPRHSWLAQYEGVCRVPTCLKVIDVGQAVVWNREGTQAIHARHTQH